MVNCFLVLEKSTLSTVKQPLGHEYVVALFETLLMLRQNDEWEFYWEERLSGLLILKWQDVLTYPGNIAAKMPFYRNIIRI